MMDEVSKDPNPGPETTAGTIGYVCPACGLGLQRHGEQLTDDAGHVFQIRQRIPRFVPSAGYTENFSLQWNHFPEIQLDTEHIRQSSQRFWAETGWTKGDLDGTTVLEVGSGAGRFSRVMLAESNASLFSVDYSEAVLANARNNGDFIAEGRFSLSQASIYEMPFGDGVFDRVLCLGVLQHTPDFRASVRCLAEKLRPGGHLAIDFYSITGWWTKLHAKYLLRPILKDMSPERLLKLVRATVPISLLLYRILARIGLHKLTRFLPICDVSSTLPGGLSEQQVREWCVLDTFDMFSPAYDNPQRIETVAAWVEEFGVDVMFSGFIQVGDGNRAAVVRGVKRGMDDMAGPLVR